MADKYGPIFCFHIGLRKTFLVSSWDAAKECFTAMDKAFDTRPRSLAGKLMGYDHAMFGFSPYGPYWREVRKLVSVELLLNRQLELLNHVRDSEVKLFIKELYGQWIQNGDRPVLVEMKEKCWFLAANVMVSEVAGKRYFGTVTNDYESRRCRKALEDLLYLSGIFMVSDAIPSLGWLDTVRGYTAKMKRIAREVDQVLGSWVEEHRRKRFSGSVNEAVQDFIHVMLSVRGRNFEFLPFGSGRRVRPGISFALEVVHLTLARLLHGFELGVVADLPVDRTEGSGVTLPRATPLDVTVVPRLPSELYGY